MSTLLTEEQRQFLDSTALWLRTQLAEHHQENSEIEVRFGSFTADTSAHRPLGAFVSGVNITAWQRVRALFCNTTPDAHACPPQSVLEIVTLSSDGDSRRQIEHADGTVTHQRKTRIAQRNVLFREPHSKQLVACRLSHSTETTPAATSSASLSSTAALLVRIRARTSFWHRMWRIDLSMVQQGLDREAASRAPAVYEVEVELEPARVDWSRHDFHYLALSLLLKIQEISAALVGVPGDDKQLPSIVAQSDK
jgi:hypothetical protein